MFFSRQFEASRLVTIEILLHGLKMDPLVSLHYYAPVCAAINLLVLPLVEGFEPFCELWRVWPLILFTNALVAFILNVAAVFLVGASGGLVLTLAGVLKVCVDPVCIQCTDGTFDRTFFSSRARCCCPTQKIRRCKFWDIVSHLEDYSFQDKQIASLCLHSHCTRLLHLRRISSGLHGASHDGAKTVHGLV